MRTTDQSLPDNFNPLIGGVAAFREAPISAAPQTRPFITISREGGAGGRTLAQRLIERLNQVDPGPPPWRMWDVNLVEEVVGRHRIPAALVESVDERTRNWLEDLLVNLSSSESPSEEAVYHCVAATIQTLARAGRAIIVGRGGVFVTRSLGQGIHVRLVAPLEHRVALSAWRAKVPMEEARAEVLRQDSERAEFYRRYWRIDQLLPEHFTITMNTAAIQADQMVAAVLAILPQVGQK